MLDIWSKTTHIINYKKPKKERHTRSIGLKVGITQQKSWQNNYVFDPDWLHNY